MKDIIRQAVADAAEWLYQNRGGIDWQRFRFHSAKGIILARIAASEHDDRKRREALLADFVANHILERPRIDSGPVIIPTVTITHAAFDDNVTVVGKPRIDSVLIVGPGGEAVHGGGFIGRTVMVELTHGADGKVTAREASQEPPFDTHAYNKRRKEVADAAWFLFDSPALHFSQAWLISESGKTLRNLAALHTPHPNVAVPRALLERLAKIENIPNNEDQGPGYDACPACGQCSNWQWKAGKVVAKPPIEHDPDCALEAIRKLL